MDIQERYIGLLNELFDGVDAGDFDDIQNIPEKYTYEHLMALSTMSDALDNGRTLYEQLYTLSMAYGKNMLRRKMQSGEKVKVAFLAISAAEWPAEQVYRLLEQDERIECYIVVVPLIDRDWESRRDTYRQTYRFFLQNGYHVRNVYDETSDTYQSWRPLGGVPDICIHLSPWFQSMAADYQVISLPLSCINCYVPYGMYTADSTGGSYAREFVYNKGFFHLMWRVYTDSVRNLEGYQEYGMLHGRNVACSGYPKMDCLYDPKEWSEEEIRALWKIPEEKKSDDVKKIIIAPHHSILGTAGMKFSTFHKNAYFLLYLAQKYCNEISFIFKPHPNLRLRAVEAGVFESYEEYDAYLKEWDALPNAKVVQESDYLGIFATSDGMIMDSASFLAEYLYVNKPLLFLQRDGQAFNKLGEKLIHAYYLEPGDNYTGIENFLQDVILSGNDSKKAVREEVWKNELDYMGMNQCTASEYIYNDIISLLGGL